MKKVLVTGAGGFIGSHLCEHLVEKDYDVRAFVHYNSSGSWGWLDSSRYKDDIEVVAGDIRDFDSVRKAVKGVEKICHLAALISIPYSYRSPEAYVKTNIIGTYNVLQAAMDYGIERMIHTSTSEVYGTARYVPIDENHPLQPQSPYSASKIGADHLAQSFFYSFQFPIIIARPFNTFGPRQSTRAIIPTIIAQLLDQGEEATLRLGNIHPTRDLNYVWDTVAGFIALLEGDISSLKGEIFNIGSGQEITIKELAYKIAQLLGKRIHILQEDRRKRGGTTEVERLLCDSSRMRQITGWAPKFTLEQGLKRTIEWFKAHFELYNPDRYHV